MLMKLTLGVKVLLAAFTRADPECAKKNSQVSSVRLALLGTTSVKADHKMLMKRQQDFGYM